MGYLLAAAHYLSNIMIGFLLRFRPEATYVRHHTPSHLFD
jgi:hypothetical protein